MSQLGFYHNNDVCISCRTCVIACKDKNDLPLGEKFRRVYDYAGGTWSKDANGADVVENAFSYSVSVACMHCAAPACMEICPANAIKKRDDGVVWIDEALCIGCNTCVAACPFGVPYMSTATNLAHKCDLCRSLIDNGEPPACVAACPMRCLEYGELEELRAAHGDVQQVPPITDVLTTDPSIVFTRSRLNPDGTLPGMILNAPEELESATV